jgi:Protein of unknown function (DUF3147)
VKIKVDTAALKSTKWYEFVFRFFIGGAITALAGLAAKRFGPEIGGLFLAFPAIIPATATLIKKREQQKKERAGYEGADRGRAAAAVDVAGAAMGGLGLATFALVVWLRMREWKTATALVIGTLAWFLVALSVWQFRERFCRRMRAHRPNVLTHTLRSSVDRKPVANGR